MTATATYFPPMTSDGTVTSWIPLTTTWTGDRGAGSTNYLFVTQEEQTATILAWLPDLPTCSWGLNYYPAEITATYLANSYISGYGSTISWGLAPFAACPSPFTTAATMTGMSSGVGTVCCPPDYTLFTPAASQHGMCTSSFTGKVMTYTNPTLRGFAATAESDHPVSTGAGTTYWTTTTTYYSGIILSTYVWTIPTTSSLSVIVTAPVISGWNFPASIGAVVGADADSLNKTSAASTAVSADTSEIPKGALAGIIVASILALIGIAAALGLLFMLMKTRRRLAAAEALASANTQPGGRNTIGGASSTAYDYAPRTAGGPPYSPHSNGHAHSNSGGSGFFDMQQQHAPSMQGYYGSQSPPLGPHQGQGPALFRYSQDPPYQHYQQVPQDQQGQYGYGHQHQHQRSLSAELASNQNAKAELPDTSKAVSGD